MNNENQEEKKLDITEQTKTEENIKYNISKDINQFGNIILNPSKTFEYISEKPTWWLPLLFLIIISVLYVLFTFPSIIIPEKISSIMSNPSVQKLSEAQKAKYLSTSSILIRSLIGAVISTPIFLLLKTAIFYFAIIVSGYEIKFKKVFSLITWASVITSLGILIKTLLTLIKHTSEIYTSLAVFGVGMDHKSSIFVLLNNFEIFTIWNILLIGFGVGAITNMKRSKSIAIVVVLWLLWVLINTFVFNKFSGM
jgi:hypothetical protein